MQKTPVYDGRDGDAEYQEYMNRVQARFAANLSKPDTRLFKTNLGPRLWEAYLNGFDTPEARQHHNCNTCRHFVHRFGGLVTIDPNGNTHSAIWNVDDAPNEYKRAVENMLSLFHPVDTVVTGVFVSSVAQLGSPHEGGWAHYSVRLPLALVHRDRVVTDAQQSAKYGEFRRMVAAAITTNAATTVDKAVALLSGDQLYRADKVLPGATWLRDLQHKVQNTPTGFGLQKLQNIVWRAVASANHGFLHLCASGSSLGALLTAIDEGKTPAEIKTLWLQVMNPATHQRAQSAPAAGQIEQAERLIDQLGLAPSLQRRHATMDDLQPAGVLWGRRPAKPASAKKVAGDEAVQGVFGDLAPKASKAQKKIATTTPWAPASTMTWEKFKKTLLPQAKAIQVLLDNPTRRAGLVTAEFADAPPLLAWDREEQRNPLSWYYAAGIDGEVKRRVEAAGGKYTGVDMRASLIWNNRNDLDIHVRCRSPRTYGPEEHVYYGSRRGSYSNWWLDVDMNISGESMTPVENMRVDKGNARDGEYTISVHRYSTHQRTKASTAIQVELELFGKVYQIRQEQPAASKEVKVATFDVVSGKVKNLLIQGAKVLEDGPAPDGTNGNWADVRAIVRSPNMYGDTPMPQFGDHTLFLIDAPLADDLEAQGFFPETTSGDLHGIRATLEAYNNKHPVGPVDNAAHGVGYVAGSPWNLKIRVATDLAVSDVLIDRFD